MSTREGDLLTRLEARAAAKHPTAPPDIGARLQARAAAKVAGMTETVRRGNEPAPAAGPLRSKTTVVERPPSIEAQREELGRKAGLGERFSHAANRFAQTFTGDVPAGFLDGIAVLSKELDPFGEYEGQDAGELATAQAAERIRDFAARAFPTNPNLQGRFVEDVLPQAFGSMAGFMATSVVGRLVGASGAATAATAGAGMQGGGAYREARAAGATDEDARDAGLLNMPLGAVEALPVERVLNAGVHAATTGAGRIGREALIAAGEETLQEVGQQVGGNYIASDLVGYDPDRPLLEGVPQAAGAAVIVGGSAGAGATSVGQMVARRRERSAAPPPLALPANGPTAAPPPPAEAVQAVAAAKAAAGAPVVVAPRRAPGEPPKAPAGNVSVVSAEPENDSTPPAPAAEAEPQVTTPPAAPPLAAAEAAPTLASEPVTGVEPGETAAPVVENAPSSPPAVVENVATAPSPTGDDVRARALAAVPGRYRGGKGRALEAFVGAFQAGFTGARVPLMGKQGNATRDGYAAGQQARAATAAEAPAPAPPSQAETATDQSPAEDAHAEELREALGVSASALDAYDPAAAVSKTGRAWTYRDVNGKDTPAAFPTRREATEAAAQHLDLKRQQYDRPDQYTDVVRVRAGKRLALIEQYRAEGMTEMEAGARARAEVPDAPPPSPPERADLLGTPVEPTVEQPGLFTPRDLAPGEKAEAERISARPMNAEEVAANTRAMAPGDGATDADTIDFLSEPSSGTSYLEGLEDPAPVEAAATRTEEDTEYEFRPPSRRGIMYRAELAKARALTDAALLKAYKERLRVAVRTSADETGKGGSFARANATSADARLTAYEQAIEARPRLVKPTTIDAWRDVPPAERADRFVLFQALQEAEELEDGELLAAVETAQARFMSNPVERADAERVYALAAVAKDRGLIGGSMFPEELGALYAGREGERTARLIRNRAAAEGGAQRGSSDARMFEAMRGLGSGPKSYAAPAVAKAAPPEDRVPPAPIIGGEVKPLDEIILDLSKGVSRRIRRAKLPGGVAGTYYPGSARTVIRYAGDLDVTAHEVAHSLDDRFGIVSDWAAPRKKSPFDADLIPNFSRFGSETKSGPRARLSYRRAEGVAEWVRAWIVNPEEAERRAPLFAAHFRQKVPSDTREALASFSTDVRTFAGLNPHERTKANIEDEPRSKQTRIREELRAKLRGAGYEVTGFTWLDKLNSQLFDSLAPVMSGISAARDLRGIDQLTPDRDPEILTRLLGGTGEKLEDVLERGMVDAENQRVTPGGLDWLMGWADTRSSEAIASDLRDAAAYMVNQRVIEKADQIDAEADEQIEALEDRLDAGEITPERFTAISNRIRRSAGASKAQLSGAGGGVFADDQQAAAALADALSWPAEKRARIEEGANRYRQWSNSVLLYMVDKGRLAKREENAEGELVGGYDFIRQQNEYYVAMHRIATEIDPETFGARGPGGRRLGSAANPVQRFTGSTRMIGNPYINLITQTQVMIREADRNEALDAFADLLRSDRKMYQGAVEDLDAIGSRAQAGDTNAIPIFHNGKEERWQFEPAIHEALKGWGINDSSGPVEFALQVPGRVMRYFVTHSPAFLVRNVVRDASHRSIVSRTGGKPWDVLHRITADERSGLRLGGGGQAGWYATERKDYYDKLRRHMASVAGEKGSILTTPVRLKEAWEKLSKESETIGRLAEYRRALAHAKDTLGYDDYNAQLYAAYQARDLIDYAVAGTLVKKINRYVPFTNPAFQGLRRMVRAAKEDPEKLAKLWAVYALAPTLLFYAMNVAGGDDDEYRQQPAYLRDFFFNLKVGPDLWLRIPKSFEAGVLASGVERAIDAIRGKEDAYDGYFHSLRNSFAPIDEDAILGPFRSVIEITANYDFFRERHIISPFEEGREVELRPGAKHASRLGKALSELVGIDPRFIDHAVQSQFGGAGRLLLRASDVGNGEKRPGELLRESGLFVGAPATQAKDVDWVMTRARELGLEREGRMRRFQRLTSKYFDAGTAEERDEIARQMRERAAELKIWLEERGARPAPEPEEEEQSADL